jgi:homoserine O-acetyltransferase
VLPQLELAYHTYGTLSPKGDNVVWVCHALTANSDCADWWSGLVGPGCLYDPQRWFVVCANMLGSCYGSSGPLQPDPATGQPYYRRFPPVTVRDTVRALQLLRDHLGINQIHTLLGGSMGGQQTLEWAVQEPDRMARIVPIATNAVHSPWGRAFNATQRMALEADPTFEADSPTAGQAGLAAARAVAMLSYRNYQTYDRTQQDTAQSGTEAALEGYRADSYQRYQGHKLVQRFHAHAYWRLTQAMDSHHLGRNRPGGIAAALAQIHARTLVVGISSDLLFPVAEQQLLAQHIPGAVYREIDSPYGHDGFLVEFDTLATVISQWYAAE